DRDYHNGTLKLYIAHSGRKLYYSFNYGSIHFITLNTDSRIDNLIDPAQIKWLDEDLKKFSDSNAIFVITNHPVLTENKKKRIIDSEKNKALTDILEKNRVKAVFSGGEK